MDGSGSTAAGPQAGDRRRGLLLGLLFAIVIIAYADRQVIALLKPALDRELGWDADDYGTITTCFQAAVTLTLLASGWFMDRIGLRAGLAIGLGGWSLSAVAHVAARSVGQFIVARVALGGFEALGNPAGVKAVASFITPARRSVALGILNTAPNVAAIATPLLVSLLYVAAGWKGTVAIIGASGFVCLALWLLLRFPPAIPDATPAMPGAGHPATLLRARRTWAVALPKLLSDQGWWFFLFWLPEVLHRRFGLDIRHLGAPIAVIYGMAGIGAFVGGVLPAWIAGRGASALSRERVRRRVMGIAALAVLPVWTALRCESLWAAVLIVGVALAAHQAFSTNLFAFAADAVPASHVGAVVGFAAFCGNLGGTVTLRLTGWVAQGSGGGGFLWMFVGCACLYPLAWLALRLLAPPEAVNEAAR